MAEEIEPAPEPKLARMFHRERVEYWSLIAEIVAAIAVVLSLLFVGMQLRDANRVAASEARSATMQSFSTFREAIFTDRETADIFLRGSQDPTTLDEVERLRFNFMVNEMIMGTYQLYARYDDGLLQDENLEGGIRGLLSNLCTPGGGAYLQQTLATTPFTDFAQVVTERIPEFEERSGADCGASPSG